MKILKNILVAVVVILFIALVGIYFLPNNFTVTNTVDINRPAGMIYGQVSDYGKWKAWSPWMEKDPNASFKVENQPGTIGHKASWDGKEIGAGSMTISNFSSGEFVSHDILFTRPMSAKATDIIVFDGNGDKTKVTWITKGGLPFPLGRLWGLTVDRMMSPAQQKGLENLKRVCEALPMPAAVATSDSSTASTGAKAM